MDEIFKKIYDEELLNFLIFTDNYNILKGNKQINNKLLNKEIVNKIFLIITKLYVDHKKQITNESNKKNLLNILNYIRFNYQYENEQEKIEIINKVNQCIVALNCAEISKYQAFTEKKTNNKEVSFVIDMEYEELASAFFFTVLYYYCENEESLIEYGVPLFIINCDFYINSIYDLINKFPNLLLSREFLYKTKKVLIIMIDCFKNNRRLIDTPDKKNALKEIKRLNKCIKWRDRDE